MLEQGINGLDSICIAEWSEKIRIIAQLKFKGKVPVFAETVFMVNTAYVDSIGNNL